MHDNLLVRVFSARDYESHGNCGAVLLVIRTVLEAPVPEITFDKQITILYYTGVFPY